VPTRELLVAKANVHRPPTNCGPTTKGLAEIDAWLGDEPWDLIHFNWGLHDLKYIDDRGRLVAPSAGRQQVPIDDYERNLEQLVRRLLRTGAVLIWRTTTPVPPGSAGRVPEDAARYNEVAARVMARHGVAVQDLFTFSAERMGELMLAANVHYTKAGYAALAERVALAIEFTGDQAADSRVVLSGAAPVPWRSPDTEEVVNGGRLDRARMVKAAETAVRHAEPMEQNEYKIHLFRGLIERQLAIIAYSKSY